MKILQLNWKAPFDLRAGGAEKVTLDYMRALVERGHEVHWFSNDAKSCLNNSKEHIRFICSGNRLTSIFHAIKYYKKHSPFDLVIDQHHGLPWFTPLWANDSKRLSNIHEVLGPIWSKVYRWPLSTIGEWQEKYVLKKFYKDEQFFTGSPSLIRELVPKCEGLFSFYTPFKKPLYIPYGCDIEPLKSVEDKTLDKAKIKFITISRLVPNKQIEKAIDFFIEFDSVNAELTIVGSGEERYTEKLKRYVLSKYKDTYKHKNIYFVGKVSDETKIKLITQSDFHLNFSLKEGWGLNNIECAALGVPTIGYDVAGSCDSVVNYETGLLFPKAFSIKSITQLTPKYALDEKCYRYMQNKCLIRAKEFQKTKVLEQFADTIEHYVNGTIPALFLLYPPPENPLY